MKNLLSIFLALIVLVGNMGLTFSTHYCCGISVKHVVTIGQHGLDCGMAGMDENADPFPEGHDTVLDKVCCKDQHETMDVDDAFEVPDLPTVPVVATAFVETFQDIYIPWYVTEYPALESYHPPSTGQGILLLQQAFRL